GCLRKHILNYFGEQADDKCGMCSGCEAGGARVDVTEIALPVVRLIQQSGARFGAGMIIDVLRGSKSEKVISRGLSRFDSYGALALYDQGTVSELLDGLIDKEFLRRTEGEYPVIMLGKNALKLLSGEMNMTLKHMPAVKTQKPKRTKAKPVLNMPENSLFEYLRAMRMMLARQTGVAPFMVLTDACLKDLCAKRPHTLDDLLDVSGIGEAKIRKYGNEILKAIYKWEAENE
ncbi:MAG: HRDC domain-containing protein, partial [Clostridia bacterium]|nr:HRDC domain-containing protein [Clostridia bacterium]